VVTLRLVGVFGEVTVSVLAEMNRDLAIVKLDLDVAE